MEPHEICLVACLDGSQESYLKWALWDSKWLTGGHFKILHKISKPMYEYISETIAARVFIFGN